MKNLAALIIDDDPEQADYLKITLEKLPIFLTIKIINDSTQGYAELLENKYDLLFLDIEMPTLSGIELIKSLDLPPTIVVSSHPSYAVECFDLDSVVDFVEKPFTSTRINRAIRRGMEKVVEKIDENTVYFKAGHRNQQYKLDEILYIEADGIYSMIYMKSGERSLINSNISEVEKQLQHTQLVRLHKSYIYNCVHIASFDSRHLWIGNQKFALGVSYRGRLAEYLNIDPNF